MPVCGFEVRAPLLSFGRDVPAPASLVGDERELVRSGDFVDEIGIAGDGAEAVGDGEVGAFE